MQYVIRGMAGLQGPHYSGTNTLHRRNVIYGLCPEEIEIGRKGLSLVNTRNYLIHDHTFS